MTRQTTAVTTAMEDDTAQGAVSYVEKQMTMFARTVRASIREAATAVDSALTSSGYKLLRLISRCGPMQASATADALGVDRSVVSRDLPLLETLGLLERRADTRDGRARVLALTPRAEQLFLTTPALSDTHLHNALLDWPTADLIQLGTYMEKLNAFRGITRADVQT